MAKLWPDIPHDASALFVVLFYYWSLPAYTLLAFAPAILLGQARRVKKSPLSLAVIGGTELIVFVAFLAMLFVILRPNS